jgi:protein-disulfide isomerase
MRHLFACLFAVLLFTGALGAQTSKTTDHKPPQQKTEAPAAPSAAQGALPTAATVNGFLSHMFGHDASIKWQIAQIKPASATGLAEVDVVLSNPQGQQMTKLFVTADGKHAVVGELVPFGADPFAADRARLQAEARGPAEGPADAALTIVEFGDLQCPSCKAAQPTVDKLVADTNARLVFQPFPLTQIHKWAMKASLYGECVAQQGSEAYFKFMKNVYQNQEQITADAGAGESLAADAAAKVDAALKLAATTAGANAEAAAACAARPETEARVRQSMALGVALDVTGTPTLFLNGRKVSNVNGVPYEVLKGIAQYLASHK